jgi:hypothetical protein
MLLCQDSKITNTLNSQKSVNWRKFIQTYEVTIHYEKCVKSILHMYTMTKNNFVMKLRRKKHKALRKKMILAAYLLSHLLFKA